jgi:hypothetical protein
MRSPPPSRNKYSADLPYEEGMSFASQPLQPVIFINDIHLASLFEVVTKSRSRDRETQLLSMVFSGFGLE